MGLSFTKREIRLQSGILHYKMGFLGYKRDSHVAIQVAIQATPATPVTHIKYLSKNDK